MRLRAERREADVAPPSRRGEAGGTRDARRRPRKGHPLPVPAVVVAVDVAGEKREAAQRGENLLLPDEQLARGVVRAAEERTPRGGGEGHEPVGLGRVEAAVHRVPTPLALRVLLERIEQHEVRRPNIHHRDEAPGDGRDLLLEGMEAEERFAVVVVAGREVDVDAGVPEALDERRRLRVVRREAVPERDVAEDEHALRARVQREDLSDDLLEERVLVGGLPLHVLPAHVDVGKEDREVRIDGGLRRALHPHAPGKGDRTRRTRPE